MKSLSSALLLTSFIVTVISSENSVIVSEDTEVFPTLGVVPGAIQCGELEKSGRLVQWRIEGCDTKDSICRFPADGKLRKFEIDFAPIEESGQLALKIELTTAWRPEEPEETRNIYDKPVQNSNVTAKNMYTVKGAFGISNEFQGKKISIQYTLYPWNEFNPVPAVCAWANFQMV